MLENPMGLSREDVQRVALLARLRLTAEEESQLTDQLGKILQYMEKLNQLDSARGETVGHGVEIVNAMREDRVTNRPNTEALLANAPARDGTFFQVPKIIE
jgi:aspartyl-tRNA(Asn)/glutamyl-tRNA(Gln) amidotransferase subunit C